jgi:hypothetical protein
LKGPLIRIEVGSSIDYDNSGTARCNKYITLALHAATYMLKGLDVIFRYLWKAHIYYPCVYKEAKAHVEISKQYFWGFPTDTELCIGTIAFNAPKF